MNPASNSSSSRTELGRSCDRGPEGCDSEVELRTVSTYIYITLTATRSHVRIFSISQLCHCHVLRCQSLGRLRARRASTIRNPISRIMYSSISRESLDETAFQWVCRSITRRPHSSNLPQEYHPGMVYWSRFSRDRVNVESRPVALAFSHLRFSPHLHWLWTTASMLPCSIVFLKTMDDVLHRNGIK